MVFGCMLSLKCKINNVPNVKNMKQTPLKEPLIPKVLYSLCSVILCQYTVLLEKTGLISSKPLPSAFIL